MTNVQIGSSENPVAGNAGAIVGYANTSTYKVRITGCSVQSGNIYANKAAGIVVGTNSGEVDGCSNAASVSGAYAAGITWDMNNGRVLNCTNKGTVTGSSRAAGIVFEARYIVENCSNEGGVSSENGYASGIYCNTSQSKYNRNTGNVTGTYAAGIASPTSSGVKVYASWNEGTITATNGVAGGIATTSTNTCEIVGCYNIGTVIGTTKGSILGDLKIDTYVGNNTQNIIACYATNTDVAMIGEIEAVPTVAEGETTYAYKATISKCYYLSENAVGNNAGNVDVQGMTQVSTVNNTLDYWTGTAMSELNTLLGGDDIKASFSYIAGDDVSHPLKLQM